jgi:hypothetical protein
MLDVQRDTQGFPAEERFGLIAQLRRDAASVAATFAEGSGWYGERELACHLSIAAGSASEDEYHGLSARPRVPFDRSVRAARRPSQRDQEDASLLAANVEPAADGERPTANSARPWGGGGGSELGDVAPPSPRRGAALADSNTARLPASRATGTRHGIRHADVSEAPPRGGRIIARLALRLPPPCTPERPVVGAHDPTPHSADLDRVTPRVKPEHPAGPRSPHDR